MVKVEVPFPATEDGLKLEVAAEGKPVTLKVTFPLNPFRAEIVAVYVVELPCTTV